MPHSKISLFAQILGKVDREIFRRTVKHHQSDKHSKGNDSWTHLISMLFMQFANATSLRDITNGLRSATGNLSHLRINQGTKQVWIELYLDILVKLTPILVILTP